MRDKRYAGIIAGIFVVAITAFTIWGSDFLQAKNSDEVVAMDVNGAEGVKSASYTEDSEGNVTGYEVVTVSTGFAGDVELTISFDADGTTVSGLVLGENGETEGLGTQIGDAAFTDTIKGVSAPVHLAGNEGTGTEIQGVTGATYSSTAVETGINNAYNFIQANK